MIIKHLHSTTTDNKPEVLELGEIAINHADKQIYILDAESDDIIGVIPKDLGELGNLMNGEGAYSLKQKNANNNNQATGIASAAFGYDTKALGDYAFAEGYSTTASGFESHAEGGWTMATGRCSHAEGEQTYALVGNTHAEGQRTSATNYAAHAEGDGTLASGYISHAEGQGAIASGSQCHAEGQQTTATNYCSHAEGYQTIASGGQSHAEGGSTTASGYCSHAEGQYTIATGSSSHVEGYFSMSMGAYCHAEGERTTATTQASHAEGQYTISSGVCSHAEGNNTRAIGHNSHAEGCLTTAQTNYSHTEGYKTIASGETSHAEGNATIASGAYSHAEGTNTTADSSSHVEGVYTLAKDVSWTEDMYAEIIDIDEESKLFTVKDKEYKLLSNTSVSDTSNSTTITGEKYAYNNRLGQEVYKFNIGGTNYYIVPDQNKVYNPSATNGNINQGGYGSHAEGFSTKVYGDASHVEGVNTVAYGYSSHAEGSNAMAYGNSSHAEGTYTVAYNTSEHACGRFNESELGTSLLFSIGNGHDEDTRHNAFEVYQNGKVYINDIYDNKDYYQHEKILLQDKIRNLFVLDLRDEIDINEDTFDGLKNNDIFLDITDYIKANKTLLPQFVIINVFGDSQNLSQGLEALGSNIDSETGARIFSYGKTMCGSDLELNDDGEYDMTISFDIEKRQIISSGTRGTRYYFKVHMAPF